MCRATATSCECRWLVESSRNCLVCFSSVAFCSSSDRAPCSPACRVFLATNVTQSFAFKFSLADLCEALVGTGWARLPSWCRPSAAASPALQPACRSLRLLPCRVDSFTATLLHSQEDEFGAKPSERSMLDILKQRFDCEELEARLAPSSSGGGGSSAAADGLQVVAEHSTGDSEDDIKFTVRCAAADRFENFQARLIAEGWWAACSSLAPCCLRRRAAP